jgi:hypothetical protein
MKFVENYNRTEYIDWLIAYMGYTYNEAVNMADFMQVTE